MSPSARAWAVLAASAAVACNAILGLDPREARPPAPTARCGDGVRSEGEACDGDDLAGATCASAVGPTSRGLLACTSSCTLDVSACCGDRRLGRGEACDGADLGGATCASLFGPLATGRLRCAADCALDTAECCGDGVRGGAEACDGLDVGGASCTSLLGAGVSGALSCTPACAHDTARCCGDGVRTSSEACDADDLGGRTCASLGHDGGELACRGCSLDESGCLDCAPGEVICDDACVDLSRDRRHCGRCGAACADGLVCAARHCTSREWALWDVTHGPQIVPQASGSVLDLTTSLVWQRAVNPNPCNRIFATCAYDEAVQHCDGLVLDGWDDWRLPTRIELLSLVDGSTVGPTLPIGPAAFDTFAADNFFWTASRHPWLQVDGRNVGFVVYFGHPRNLTDVAGGAARYAATSTAGLAKVRCVRAGVGS